MKLPRVSKALLAALLAFVCAAPSDAHTSATTFVGIKAQTDSLVLATVDMHVRDLHQALRLDTDGDDAITWGEIEQAGDAIAALVQSNSELRTHEDRCRLHERSTLAVADYDGEPYVRLSLRFACNDAGVSLVLDHSRWFTFDPGHRAMVDFSAADGGHASALLTAEAPRARAAQPLAARLRQFLVEGVRHLLSGYDHIAFLCVLLLGLARAGSEPAVPLSTMLRRALLVITSFTLAHSLTLLLAATGALVLPSRPVEIVIAASIVVVACLNLTRLGGVHGWLLALVFGLVHGLGFAGALADLTAGHIDLPALAAFNIGIELGQVALALLAVPAVWLIARHAQGRRFVLPLASLTVAVVAVGWVIERT